MTIHFFTFSVRTQPSSRQRTFYASEELQKRGYETIIHMPTVLSLSKTPWPQKGGLLLQIIRALFTIKKDDIVYLQRAVYNKYFFVIMVVYLVLFRRKMIFDFDDPIYVHSFFKTKVFTQLADAVVVATHRQAEWAQRYSKNVHLVYFVIDPTPYEKLSKDYTQQPEQPIIGWLGTGPEHLKNLPILVPVFTRLAAEKDTPFTFVLIGSFNNPKVLDLFENIPNLVVKFIDRISYTDPDAAPKEVRKFDIGVVPHQSEGEWNKGKTSMKILEYMACQVPAIVSTFGEMPYIITDGVNGFTAATEDEWVEKLTLLLKDHALRERMGKAGQHTVREQYSFDVIAPQMVQVINSVYGPNDRKSSTSSQ
jgi:glycosyltransferase involved in cell wall biosynthesis